MANADLPEEESSPGSSPSGWIGTRTTWPNDTFTVPPGRTADSPGASASGAGVPWGVAVTCGAGINCVGVAPDGQTHPVSLRSAP